MSSPTPLDVARRSRQEAAIGLLCMGFLTFSLASYSFGSWLVGVVAYLAAFGGIVFFLLETWEAHKNLRALLASDRLRTSDE